MHYSDNQQIQPMGLELMVKYIKSQPWSLQMS